MMRSQLVSATVTLAVRLGYTPVPRVHSAFSDIFSALKLSADTLQELDLSLGTPVNPVRDVPVSLRFPRVHTLRTILDTYFPQCIVLRLFPNLQNLHLIPGLDSFRISEDPNAVWFMDTLRNANGKIGLSSSLKLVECSGEVTSLYPLSAHLTASKLRMRGYLSQHELSAFRVVMAETRPIELEVSVHGLEVVEDIVGILGELEVGTCRVLTLNVSFRPGDSEGVVAEVRQLTLVFVYASQTSLKRVLGTSPCCS